MPKRSKHDCEWTNPMDVDYDAWQSGCEQEFIFTADGPTENGFKFCPFCGGKLTIFMLSPSEGK